jgi:flagellar biosynthetic protein FlhB
MAEDDTEKSEEPTGKRIQDARRKGNIAQSQEIKNWAALVGVAVSIVTFFPWMMSNVTLINYQFLERPHTIAVDEVSLRTLFMDTSIQLGLASAPVFLLFTLVALAVSYLQVGRTFSLEKIKPEFGKLNPLKGVKRLLGPKALVEFAKGLVKLIMVAVVAYFVVQPRLIDVALFPSFDLITSLKRIDDIALMLVFWIVMLMSVVAVLDYMYQRHSVKKSLMMTKQEVKDEHKQLEGDPKVKARLASIRQERARQRMIANVSKADVVITNPTHYAVALEYDMEKMPAPRLIAKGVDEIAKRIREEADEHDVPIVENPPLARALYAAVELDQEVPPEHYKAVAEVIGYVFRLKGKLQGDGPIRPPKPDWSIDPGDPEADAVLEKERRVNDPTLH